MSTNSELISKQIMDLIAAAKSPKSAIDALKAELGNARTGMNANALMNGNFDIWQRGDSASVQHLGYIADRWQNVLLSGATLTVSKQPVGGDIPGSAYYHRLTIIDPSDLVSYGRYNIMQAIENGTRLLCGAGRKVTLSFWARSSIPGKRIGVNLHQDYGTGGSPSPFENIYGRYFDLTSSWQRFVHTFNTNTLVGKTFGTDGNDVLTPQIWFMWGSDYAVRFGTDEEPFRGTGTIDIAQVQLLSGDADLPYQPRSVADELSLCQRYNQRFTALNGSYAVIGSGTATSPPTALIHVPVLTAMRVARTLTFGGALSLEPWGILVTNLTIDNAQSTKSLMAINAIVASGLQVGQSVFLRAPFVASAFVSFDAEY